MHADARDTSSANPPGVTDDAAGGAAASGLNGFVFALFFIFGGITSLNDVHHPQAERRSSPCATAR